MRREQKNKKTRTRQENKTKQNPKTDVVWTGWEDMTPCGFIRSYILVGQDGRTGGGSQLGGGVGRREDLLWGSLPSHVCEQTDLACTFFLLLHTTTTFPKIACVGVACRT